MALYKILCTVPSTIIPRSPFDDHNLNKVASFEFWEEEYKIPKSLLIEKLRGADALLTDSALPIDKEVIYSAKDSLKIIADVGVGYDNIDIETATKHGIPVCNNPHILQDNVAELNFALMLTLAKNIFRADQHVRSGNWIEGQTSHNQIDHTDSLLGSDMKDSNLLVVGLGETGVEVCRRAIGFRMDISYYSRTRKKDLERELGISWVSKLEEGIRRADFISINVPLTDETYHMFGSDQFKLMKSNAILVNTARGEIIDTESLYEALVENEIAGAGVDAINPEPIPIDHPLLTLKNFIATPHIGGHSVSSRRKLAESILSTLELHLTQGKLTNCVNM